MFITKTSVSLERFIPEEFAVLSSIVKPVSNDELGLWAVIAIALPKYFVPGRLKKIANSDQRTFLLEYYTRRIYRSPASALEASKLVVQFEQQSGDNRAEREIWPEIREARETVLRFKDAVGRWLQPE